MMEDYKLETENGVTLDTTNTVLSYSRQKVMYNSNLSINRSVAVSALSAFLKKSWQKNEPPRCLDAFGATGVAGILWAKHFPEVHVTINDPLEKACDKIKKNKELNEVNVCITQKNVDVLLLEETFDFVFLQCHGSAVQHLSSVFQNMPEDGLLVITSADEAALYGKAPDVTLRNYAGYIIKTFYYKELAARLIVACAAREAAKFNKGIEVMCCIAVRSHITVILRVSKGHSKATDCVKSIQKVIHCCICEDRAFLTETVHPIEEPYSYLSCTCREETCPKIAKELGPVWTGSLFDRDFCSKMLEHAISQDLPRNVRSILEIVVDESDCTLIRQIGKRDCPGSKDSNLMSPPTKKVKIDSDVKCPPFYYNLHKHSPKGYDIGRLNNLVTYIRNSGFLASRTHFDHEAIRTSAKLNELKELLKNFFRCRV